MQLCAHCYERQGRKFGIVKGRECFLCGNIFERVDGLIRIAKEKAEGIEYETFSVSSSIPNSLLAREEIIWDFTGVENSLALKNEINAILAKKIAETTGKKFTSENPDLTFAFDFSSNDVNVKINPLYIFGHYRKFSRELAQSRWMCLKCRGKGCAHCNYKGILWPSLEEILGDTFLKFTKGRTTRMHAAGREDIDARMLGNGRPFIIEILEPKKRKINLGEVEKEINKGKEVKVRGLKFTSKSKIEILTNARFEKKYFVLAECGKIGKKEIEKLNRIAPFVIHQRTPRRVLHRRADLLRIKKIKKMRAGIRKGRLGLEIVAEAGTYIKEFITGDGGRTKPSISGILGRKCECKELDVLWIYDKFLEGCI